MANNIAVLDRLKSPTGRYFIVYNITFMAGEAQNVDILELGTRKLHRHAYRALLQLIEQKKLVEWQISY